MNSPARVPVEADPVDVTLVLPCYHEAQYLEDHAHQLVAVLQRLRVSYEIIFVEDGGTDDTRAILQRLTPTLPGARAIFHDRNQGRGAAVTTGVRAARGTVVGFIDVDLETPAIYLPAMLLNLLDGQADVVSAWRRYEFRWDSIGRWLMSRGYQQLQRAVLGLELHDTETGCKFFRREVALALIDRCQDRHWFWDTEIMAYARLGGFRVLELPALFLRRTDFRSTVQPLRDTWRQLRALLAFRARLRREFGPGPWFQPVEPPRALGYAQPVSATLPADPTP